MNEPLTLDLARERFLGYLRVEAGCLPKTVEEYGRDVRDFVEDARRHGVLTTEQLTARTFEEHLARLKTERGLDARTVVRHLATMRVFCKWLLTAGLTHAHLGEHLERPSAWRRLPEVVSPNQIRRLLTHGAPEPSTQGTGAPLWVRDRAILELLYASGLRNSECVTLRVEDADLTLGVVRVTGKGDKTRLVPFGEPAERAMVRYLSECRPRLVRPGVHHAGRMFLSNTGRPLERTGLWHIVKRCARRAGLEQIYPHLIRHSFATHLLGGGADLRAVQEMLGHASVETTQVYTHVDRTDLARVIRTKHPRG
ncbi:MAG: site-specific tyrosine recombinase XerD [Phycisphaerales bacterium]